MTGFLSLVTKSTPLEQRHPELVAHVSPTCGSDR